MGAWDEPGQGGAQEVERAFDRRGGGAQVRPLGMTSGGLHRSSFSG